MASHVSPTELRYRLALERLLGRLRVIREAVRNGHLVMADDELAEAVIDIKTALEVHRG